MWGEIRNLAERNERRHGRWRHRARPVFYMSLYGWRGKGRRLFRGKWRAR